MLFVYWRTCCPAAFLQNPLDFVIRWILFLKISSQQGLFQEASQIGHPRPVFQLDNGVKTHLQSLTSCPPPAPVEARLRTILILLFPVPAAAIPFLMPFTINFTITNLSYTKDMGDLDSEMFNATERDLQHLVRVPHQCPPGPTPTCHRGPSHSSPTHSFQLRPLFRNSSIGSLYTGCRLTLLR